MIRIGKIYYEAGRMYVKRTDGKLHEFSVRQWREACLQKGSRRW